MKLLKLESYKLNRKYGIVSSSDEKIIKEYSEDATRSAFNLMLLALHKKGLLERTRKKRRVYYKVFEM